MEVAGTSNAERSDNQREGEEAGILELETEKL